MARICDICNKGPRTGNKVTRRGLEKNKGCIGFNTTGLARRRFLPNIQKIRVMVNGSAQSRKVCTACIKAGRVVKAV